MFRKVLMFGALLGVILVGSVVYLYLKPTLPASQQAVIVPVTGGTADPILGSTGLSATTSAPAQARTSTPSSSSGQVFQIDPSQSTASFTIHEVLNGSPNTVVGTTNQVSGQIEVNSSSPQDSQVGTIKVDARTLATDSDMRNRAIKNRILLTDQYEFVTFTPTQISGLPDAVQIGQTYPLQITGDLTIAGQTHPVTFSANVTPVSATQLKGNATTTLNYSDFGISIPQVPFVASVENSVILAIDFVAVVSGS